MAKKSSVSRGTVPNGIEPTRQWRNRIVGSGEEDAAQLLANPRNWRVHPKAQQQALAGVLDAVGWVQNVIVNRTTGFVVDGHARVAMAISRGEKVPVVYVELTEEEEALILATLDPLSAMAGTDKDLLASLTGTLIVPEGALADMIAELAKENGLASAAIFPEYDESAADQVKWLVCPECLHKWPA